MRFILGGALLFLVASATSADDALSTHLFKNDPFFPDGTAQSGIFQTIDGDYMLCFRTRPYYLCKRFAPSELESCNALPVPGVECGDPELFTVGTPL